MARKLSDLSMEQLKAEINKSRERIKVKGLKRGYDKRWYALFKEFQHRYGGVA